MRELNDTELESVAGGKAVIDAVTGTVTPTLWPFRMGTTRPPAFADRAWGKLVARSVAGGVHK